jgi:hypothetical protein
VRHSLSLEYMLQTTDDGVFELFATPEATPTQLAALLLGRSIPKYGNYFDRILYGPASLGFIVSKLSKNQHGACTISCQWNTFGKGKCLA